LTPFAPLFGYGRYLRILAIASRSPKGRNPPKAEGRHYRCNVANRRIVWKNSQNGRSRKSRFHASNPNLRGNRHDEAHGRATRGKIASAANPLAKFYFKVLYCRLNCDRREKPGLLSEICRSDVFIVAKLGRLGRNTRDVLNLVGNAPASTLQRRGVFTRAAPPLSTALASSPCARKEWERQRSPPSQRDRHLQTIARHGCLAWQKQSGDAKRERTEAGMS
jgi:hypothetical protein